MKTNAERNAFWQRQAERYTREAAKAQDEAGKSKWLKRAVAAEKYGIDQDSIIHSPNES